MPLRRLAIVAAIVCLLLAVLHPHCASAGWTDLGTIGAMCHRWRHHPFGTIALIVILASTLWQPRSNG